MNSSDPSGMCNANPFSGSFWTNGNCLAGAVGGPSGDSSSSSQSGAGTEGYCVSLNLTYAIANGQVSACVVKTVNGRQVGVTATWGYGLGVDSGDLKTIAKGILEKASGQPLRLLKMLKGLADASGDATWQTSNATDLSQLRGKFNYSSFNGGWVLNGGWERFHSPCKGSTVSGTDWSLGFGGGIQMGSGTSETGVHIFDSGSLAARVASDEINAFNALNPFSWFYGE